MSHPPSQSLGDHTRWVPLYHFVLWPILLINAGYSVYLVVRLDDVYNWVRLAVAIALLLLCLLTRQFATRLQDRMIRLEEQVRYAHLLPADLRDRIHEFHPDQLIALRFASDAELPALARQVLDQRILDRDTIKEMIHEWRPDHLRV